MHDQAENLRKLALASKRKKKDTCQNSPSKPRNMRIMTVVSGKGGVGKTCTAVNVAVSLSKLGKKVLILDADLGMANVDIMLGVVPKYTLFDVLKGEKELREIVVSGPEGVKIIPGGSGVYEMIDMDDRERKEILDELCTLFDSCDYLIIDCGAGITKSILGFIAAADDVIVVITPEPTSITDGYTILKILSHYKLQKHAYIIVNRVSNSLEAERTAQKIASVSEKFLEIDVKNLGFISDESLVRKAIIEQKPFVTLFPKSKATKDIQKIVHNIDQGEIVYPSKGSKGFFRKIFSLFK